MRALAVAAAIIAFAVTHANWAAEQIITIRLTPDPSITAHIEGIRGPAKSLWASVHKPDSSQSKRQQVIVRGQLADSDVAVLLNSALAMDRNYWSTDSRSAWEVGIVGDKVCAVVRVAMYCGELCGGGAAYTYAFRDGSWKYEYTSEQWVS